MPHVNIDATLLFDFDGTVRLGWEHSGHYARLVADELPDDDRRAFLAAHEAFLAGRPTTASTFDAYDPDNAVRRLSGEYGVADADRQAAYEATRERMAEGEFKIWAPEGIRELIWGLPKQVEVVLVTNAPAASLEPSSSASAWTVCSTGSSATPASPTAWPRSSTTCSTGASLEPS
ncbi:hypothetical protein GCM10029992_32020 [Glycomyces albus]